jgi:hypothetical protein
MTWRVEFLDDRVQAELEAQPADIRARFLRITRLIEAEGIHKLREPYVKHLEGPVWEMRMKGRDGIGTRRLRHCIGATGRHCSCVYEEHPEDATARARDGP